MRPATTSSPRNEESQQVTPVNAKMEKRYEIKMEVEAEDDKKPILTPYPPPPAQSLPWHPSVAAVAEDAEEAPLVIDEENPDPTEVAKHPAGSVAGTTENFPLVSKIS